MFQQSLSLPAIAAELRKLCQKQQTGILYLIDNGHLLGQISLQQGEITALSAKKKQGIDALSILLDIQNGGVAFAPGPLTTPRMALPPTADILAIFDRAEWAATLSHPGTPPSPPPAPLALSAAAKTVLEQTLKEFIGPIAKMICADHFRAAKTLEAAIEALADEIPNPQAASQFRERVQQRLR